MTTKQRTRTTKTAEAPKATAKKEAPKEKAPTSPTYREATDFGDALKSAKASAKGNTDLVAPLQLITHLAWKTPASTVGWAKGTTPAVIEFADDIAVPAGTSLPDAMDAALGAADKATADKAQKDALGVLSKVIKGHS